MSEQPKKRKRKLLRDYDIPPYQVPDDWEPQSEVVKRHRKLLAEIPQGIKDMMYQMYLEQRRQRDPEGQRAREIWNSYKEMIESAPDEDDDEE